MTTQINWEVVSLQCKPQENGFNNVVITAFWRCVGVNGQYNFMVAGACSLPAPGDPFTPYADLTKQQVLQWCWDNGVNKAAAEACVEEQIQEQINPPVVALPLPWAGA